MSDAFVQCCATTPIYHISDAPQSTESEEVVGQVGTAVLVGGTGSPANGVTASDAGTNNTSNIVTSNIVTSNIVTSNIVTSNIVTLQVSAQLPGPLRNFPIFMTLPYEIRIKIWQAAFDQNGRLIELQWTNPGNPETGYITGTHEWWQVCPRSRELPVIMRVCKESMVEGKIYLDYRLFDSDNDRLPVNKNFKIYYNPRADTIFFGERTCLTTVINLFSETPGVADLPIPRVAILCSPRVESCCDHGHPDYGVEGGVDIMQALHGFDELLTRHKFRYGGCTGLQEAHLIVNSRLWQRAAGEIDCKVSLRPATTKGFTNGERVIKERLERHIAVIDDGHPIPRTGKYSWAKAKPEFHFSSLAPVSTLEEEVHDGLTLDCDDLADWEEAIEDCAKDVGRLSGCSVHVEPPEHPQDTVREIGFAGSKAAVKLAKEIMESALME